MTKIHSLSRGTKHHLSKLLAYFQADITELGAKADNATNPDEECTLRIQIVQRSRQISDLDKLINQAPTTEDIEGVTAQGFDAELATNLIAS